MNRCMCMLYRMFYYPHYMHSPHYVQPNNKQGRGKDKPPIKICNTQQLKVDEDCVCYCTVEVNSKVGFARHDFEF